MKRRLYWLGVLLHIGIIAGPGAQGQLIEVRRIDSAVAVTAGAYGYLDRVRELPDGRVLVNDAMSRRVLAFSPDLDTFTVVVDSVRSDGRGYGPLASALVPSIADSTLLIDGTSLSMIVIDPRGVVTRVAAAPEIRALVVIGGQSVGFDHAGRLVFRDSYVRSPPRGGATATPPLTQPDSAPLVAYDPISRRRDTLALLRVARMQRVSTRRDNVVRAWSVPEPFPLVDEAVVLADGRVAIVRGRDYRIDWVVPGKRVERGPRISFPWQRVSDEEKALLIDSLALIGRASERAAPVAKDSSLKSPLEGLTPDDMPDYRPAFVPGGVRADADGNLWVRTTITLLDMPGPVWDVIDGIGVLRRRILLPVGRGIVGFGKNGTVYMASRDGEVTRLEKARARID